MLEASAGQKQRAKKAKKAAKAKKKRLAAKAKRSAERRPFFLSPLCQGPGTTPGAGDMCEGAVGGKSGRVRSERSGPVGLKRPGRVRSERFGPVGLKRPGGVRLEWPGVARVGRLLQNGAKNGSKKKPAVY